MLYLVILLFSIFIAACNEEVTEDSSTGDGSSGTSYTSKFHPYQIIAISPSADSLAIGDVNSDGLSDIVVGTNGMVHVFLQTTSGLSTVGDVYSGGLGDSIKIGDVNNDGRNDVIVTGAGKIGVLTQKTDGTLNSVVSYAVANGGNSNTYKLALGDFNNDSLMDVVAIFFGAQSGNINVFLQQSDGTLGSPVSYTGAHQGWDDMSAGDLNSDGLDDFVIMSGQGFSDTIGVYRQNSSGNIDEPIYDNVLGSDLPNSISTGDLNNDGSTDIAISFGGNVGAGIALLVQKGGDTPALHRTYPSLDIPKGMVIKDVTNDGKNDIIVAHDGWERVGVFVQKTDGNFSSEELHVIPFTGSRQNPHGIAVGDLNSDGSNDIAIADGNNGLIILFNKL